MFKHTHVQIINNVNNHFVCQPHSLLFECMMQVKKDINKPNEVSSSCSKNHFGRLIVNYTRKCASLETPSPSGNSCLYLTCLILASSLYLRVITVRGGGGGEGNKFPRCSKRARAQLCTRNGEGPRLRNMLP